MAAGVNWIAHAFKLFDALIGPPRPPQPDQPAAAVATEGVAPEAPAADSTASIRGLEPASEADALAPPDESEIEPSPAQPIESAPVQWDDQSRRELIRQLFNDYWTGVEDKPPTFAERLQIAERYINERLADRDVGWKLDAMTRKQLGLPSR
jgi:hypothetical protein